ncbi:Dynamin-2A [Forsythia ovata]|uniref:Dynamin-2A n=1 Tax=Forsythia ovata TaxID=205694 RepID=A0ABD1U5E5_9LAMI
MARRPADPEEELRWMAQEVRGYVEAVLNSLAANVPKAVVLCQVEKAKEDMLNKLYSSISAQSTVRIEELLQEDQNTKRKRERIQKQSSLLSKLTRQLSIHDNQAAAASDYSNGGAESSPTSAGPSSGDDWRSAFDAASNGPTDSYGDSRRSSNGHSRRYSDPAQNGDMGSDKLFVQLIYQCNLDKEMLVAFLVECENRSRSCGYSFATGGSRVGGVTS